MRSQRSDGAILTRTHRLHQRLLRYLRSTPLAASLVPCTLSISHSKRFVWYRVPKVGSSSISHHFERQGVRLDVVEPRLIHLPYRRYRDYFKFAFVRNPWDRLASAFAYLKRGGSNERDRAWAAEHLAGFETLDDFVHRWLSPENVWKGVHFRPQTHFLQGRPGRIAVDFVGRFERIGDDYEVLRQRLGFGEPLPHLNRTPGAHHYDGLYTPESAAIVRNIYAEDVRLFGYEDAAPTTG